MSQGEGGVWKRTGADDERAGAAPEGATENAAFAVCLKAYPDTNREAYGAAGSRALSKRADYGTTEVVPFPVCGECGMGAAEQNQDQGQRQRTDCPFHTGSAAEAAVDF